MRAVVAKLQAKVLGDAIDKYRAEVVSRQDNGEVDVTHGEAEAKRASGWLELGG